MNTLVCMVPVCPMRKEPAHRSEMVSQLLFGEWAEVLAFEGAFVKIRGKHDGYEGWCQLAQLRSAEHKENNDSLTAEWINEILLNGQRMYLPMGCSLPPLLNGTGTLGNVSLAYSGQYTEPEKKPFSTNDLASLARQYLSTPYLWGGRTVFGIDCSGYVQQLFRFFNKTLPRDAYQQAGLGEVVGFLQEVVCGDLAFFDNAEGHITHVGLLLDEQTIIHASGIVRIDRIDTMGILNSDTGERTHTLRIIKRYW